MENRQIYEHIADTYLSSNRKRKLKAKGQKKKWFIFVTVINIVILFTVFFLTRIVLSKAKKKDSTSAIYVLSERYPLKLSYDLNSPHQGIKNFSFTLPLVDTRGYNTLKLRIKGARFSGFTKILRIEIENIRREKDSYYLEDISHKWQDVSIKLLDFKNIRDWSRIQRLSFIFEDWNVSEKKGIIYIDNIRFSE